MREVESLLAYRRQLYQAMRVGGRAGSACEGRWHGGSEMAIADGFGGAAEEGNSSRPGPLQRCCQAQRGEAGSLACAVPHPTQEAEEAAERRQAGEEARQAAIVAAERERMLREAAHLRQYLPKGVVQVSAQGGWGGGGW